MTILFCGVIILLALTLVSFNPKSAPAYRYLVGFLWVLLVIGFIVTGLTV